MKDLTDLPCKRCGHLKGFAHLHTRACHWPGCDCPAYVPPDEAAAPGR